MANTNEFILSAIADYKAKEKAFNEAKALKDEASAAYNTAAERWREAAVARDQAKRFMLFAIEA